MRVFDSGEDAKKRERFATRMAWTSPHGVSPPVHAIRSSSAASPLRPMTSSGSLPSLVPAAGLPSPLVPTSPATPLSQVKNAYESSALEEKVLLKRKIKDLETALKRTTATIQRERKETELIVAEQVEARRQAEELLNKWKQDMSKELKRVRSEADKKAALARDQGLSAAQGAIDQLSALEKEKADIQAKEKEKRIELLRRNAARRIMNQKISKGWSAWHEMWEEKVRKRRLMQGAASKLSKPAMVAAFGKFVTHWKEMKDKALERELRRRETELKGGASSLQDELERVKSEYERKLKASEQQRKELAEQLAALDGSAAEFERGHQEQLEREKQKRIEHLCGMIARRILKKDLSRGWTAWHQQWEEHVRKRQLLRHAASQLKNPELTQAYTIWKTTAAALKEAKLERKRQAAIAVREAELKGGAAALSVELERTRNEYERKLVAANAAYDSVMERLTALDGDAAEKERQLQEQIANQAAEKEKRVEHLCGMIARRIMQKDLSRGWSAWHMQWAEEVRRKRMLQHAASKLKNPELAEAYSIWRKMAESVKQALAEQAKQAIEKARQEREAELLGGATGLQAELDRVRSESERKLSDAEKTIAEMRASLSELDGGAEEAERLHEEQLAREKAQRVEHLCGMIARRILKKDLSRGWTAWHGQWEEQARMKRMLLHASGKLKNPEIAAAYTIWKDLWVDIKEAQEMQARKDRARLQRQREADLEGHSAELQAAIDRERAESARKLQTAEAAYNSVMERLKALDGDAAEKERQLQEQIANQAAEKEKRVEHLCGMIARRIMQKDLSRGWSAWHEQWEEETRRKRMLQHAANRLSKPGLSVSFERWREDWEEAEAEKAEMQRQARESEQKKREEQLRKGGAKAQDELDKYQKEYSRKLKEKNAEVKDLTAELARLKEEYADQFAMMQSKFSSEKAGAEDRLANAGSSVANMERQLLDQQAREAAAREKRVEHLGEMFARRMLKRDLANGWTAWLEQWEEASRQKGMLMRAANRLRAPQLSSCLTHWQDDWRTAMREKEQKEQRQREALLAGGAEELQALLQHAEKKYEAKLNELEASNQRLLSKLEAVDGAAAAAERKMQEHLEDQERADAMRIEHLCGMIASRMLKRDLSRGWTAWYEQWEEEARRKRMLQHAASKLKNPELSEAFHIWQNEWVAIVDAKRLKKERALQRAREGELEGASTALKGDLERVSKEYEKKLATLQAAYDSVMDKLAQYDGGAAEKERQLQEQIANQAAEKEKRVEHLCGMIARRIMKKDLSRGWSAWMEGWEEETRRKRMLQHAANRLSKPGLSVSFERWREDWEEAEAEKAEMQREAREASINRSRADLEADLVRMRGEYERKLVAADKAKQKALEDQLSELLGSHHGETQAQEEKAKQERIDLLYRQTARRLMFQDVIRGWASWKEMWEHRTHVMRCMSHAVGRLTKPALAHAFSTWAWECREIKQEKERALVAAKRAELEESLRKSQLEAGKLSMIQVANSDELRALKAKVNTLSEDVSTKNAALTTAAEERAQLDKLRDVQKMTLEALAIAEKARDDTAKHAVEQQARARAQLEELLAKQRNDMEEEAVKNKKQITSITRDAKVAKEEATKLDKELAKVKAELEKLKPKKPKVQPLVLSGDPSKSLSQQLAEALKSNSGRVLDLFRSWDTDGDGEVSRAEFHKAIPALGLEVPKADVEELFNTWDGEYVHCDLCTLTLPSCGCLLDGLSLTSACPRVCAHVAVVVAPLRTRSCAGSSAAAVFLQVRRRWS